MKKLLLLIVLVCSLFIAKAQTHWTPASGFESTMSVTGIIVIDGVEQASNQLEIGAFCGDQCRGAKIASYFPVTKQYTVPISIAGLAGDAITFKVYDHAIGQELDLTSESSLTFVINGVIPSSGFNWFQFVFTTPKPASWTDPEAWGGEVPGPSSTATLQEDIIIDNAIQVTVANLDTNGNTLIVGEGSTLEVTGTLTNDDPENLIIQEGGQIIVNNTSAQATFVKSVGHSATKDADNWYTISSPVNNIATGSVTNLIQATPANYDLYYYDEVNVLWKNHKANPIANLTNGKGYLYWNAGGDELLFPGKLNSTTVSINLTKSDNANPGWNLIGNPFSHNIYKGAGAAIDNSKLAEGYYTIQNSGAWSAQLGYSTAIKPCQGVLVQATESFNLSITNSTSPATGEKRSDNYIMFAVNNGKYEDVTYALFKDGVGLNKVNHRNAEIPMIYIQQDGQNYAIATMNDNTQMFNINFKAMTLGQYTLSYKADGNYSYLHVIDLLTGADVDMLLESEYIFVASPSDNDSRFIVKFGESNNGTVESNIFAYQSGNEVIVNGNGELQVFDLTGRMVMNQRVNGVQTVNVSKGVYILRIIGNEVRTQKIVVK